MAKVIDPVCKMNIDQANAAAESEYKGQKYYFCARACKIAFDRNPDKYLNECTPGKGCCC